MQPDRHARTAAVARPGTDTDPLLGRLLDRRYLITARIARGGMAAVYEAHDQRLDRTVAVKVMHAGLGDDTAFAARFVREARAAAKLSHPNVVSVFDQGDDDGTLFLAMELVPGHTLRDTVSAESPMAPRRALAMLEPVLGALAAAHRAGLVHRDVKPENVLITPEGAVKVADFGLARAVTAETQHTSTGVLMGTVSYIAPEIVTEGRADARADVYSAGVMLYELLTGQKPHAGETPIAVAYKHVHEDVPAPSALVAGLPPYVDALVARATARDPGLRPADAGVLLRQVQRVIAALADGLSDDPDLTADLTPPAQREDTRPEIRQSRTVAVPRETVAAPAPASVGAPAPAAALASRRRRRGPLVLVLALLLAVGVGGGAWWFGFARYTQAPGVLGLAEPVAVERLQAAGLEVELADPAYSDSVEAGAVLRTDPGPGERVLDGGTVTVTLSKGPEVYALPDLAGQTLDQAQDALLAIKMTYGQAIERWSETVPAGQVIRTEPAAATVLRPGTSVDVVVSKGRQPIELDDWTGKSADAAVAALKAAGLKVKRDRQYDDVVPAGLVISQSPPTGTLYKGDTVSLLVSRGPELVVVPQLRASGVEAATERLEELGFQVRTAHSPAYIGLGYVFSTDPKAGSKVPKGSTITLNLV